MPDDSHRRSGIRTRFAISWIRAIAPFAGLLVLSGIFLLLTAGPNTRLTQSFHGLYHASYVSQLANGIVPPTNPSSLGMPANYYWAWHGLLALLSRGAGISSFQAHLIVSWVSLTTLLSVLWVLAGRRAWSVPSRLGLCFLPFFILDPLGLSRYALLALSEAGAPSAANPSVVNLVPAQTLAGATLHPIAGHLLNKLVNFSSFPAAIALYAVALLALARIEAIPARCLVVGACAAVSAHFSPLPAAGIAGAAVAFALVRWAEGERGAAAWGPAAATGAGLLLALPYLSSITLAFESEARVFLEPGALGRRCIELGWALTPAAPVYLLAAVWNRSLSTEERAWWILGIGCSVVALVVSAPVSAPNEYKLILLTALPSSLLAIAVAREFGRRISLGKPGLRALRALTTVLLLAGAATSIGATAALYRGSSWFQQDPYAYHGRHLDVAPGSNPNRKSLGEAYRWLRENTPVTSYVLERPVHGNDSEIAAIAERRAVTVSLWHHNAKIPHQRQLQKQATAVSSALETCRVSSRALDALFAVPAPWPTEIFAIAPVRGGRPSAVCRSRLDPRIAVAYQNRHYRVFSIRR